MHLDIVSNNGGYRMKESKRISSFLAGLTVLLASGCASHPDLPLNMQASATGPTLVRTGYVSDVRDVAIQDHSRASGAPAIGMFVGGAAGSLIGNGSGRMISAIGGAIGGSLVAQGLAHPDQFAVTQVTVRFEDGSAQNYQVNPAEPFRIGEPVKVVKHNGSIRLMH